MSYKVYKLTSPNGKSYVGVTKLDLNERWQNGRGYRNITDMWNDIIQYGWDNFDKEIIFETDDEHDAREREHIEIKLLTNAYNRYRGIKEYVPTGGERTPSKPVQCVETGIVYSSIKEAARQTGLSKTKISYCCRGIRKRTGGYHWVFFNSTTEVST